MFKNYFKIAFRNILKHPTQTIINISGLAIGMACSILIFLWVQNELSFDQFHEHINEIYQVPTRQYYGSDIFLASGAPPAIGPALERDYPEVVNAARFRMNPYELLVQYGDKHFMEKIQMADFSLFKMFTMQFEKGSFKYTSSDPHVIVLTETIAAKYFKDENPIDQTLTVDNQYDFKIIGILQNIPRNSTLQFDFLVPLEFITELRGESITQWSDCSYKTFIQLHQNTPLEIFDKKIAGRVKQENENSNIEPFLFPFKRVHLHTWSGHGGRIVEVRIFIVVALLILIIACINFMNLATAISTQRAREVGLRKVLGADRRQLIRQFFGESVLVSLISLIFALLLVELFLTTLGTMTGMPLSTDYFNNKSMLVVIIGITCFTGIVSGSYPALFLSRFQPVHVLKSSIKISSKSPMLRRALVVTQFTISITLIIGTIIIFNQLHYMRNKDLGFDKDRLIYLPLNGNLHQNYSLMKNELLKHTVILNITMSSHSPTGIYSNGSGWDWEGKPDDIDPLVTELVVDGDFAKTFGMEMAQGRFFSQEFSNTSLDVVINERFADIMNMESSVGQILRLDPYALNVIGVIKNFHFKPLDRIIEPIVISNNPQFKNFRYMFINISPENIAQTIALLEKTYQKFNPDFPFEFHFLDDDYDQLYYSQKRTDQIVRYFSILAIFISGIGLFGLASFTAQQRTKELSVRKVLGASVSEIVFILTKEYTKWVLTANIIAWPIAWYTMNKWLQNFAYRVDIELWVFFIGGGVALVIALLTVSWQAVRAALANPVESLRYE
jgi:putative ABC transport system permease protein